MRYLPQKLIYFRPENIDRNSVLSAPWNDDVSMPLQRLDELLMHWANAVLVLVQNAFKISAALDDVSPNSAKEPNVIGRVNIDLDVHQAAKALETKDKDSLQDNDRVVRYMPRLSASIVA